MWQPRQAHRHYLWQLLAHVCSTPGWTPQQHALSAAWLPPGRAHRKLVLGHAGGGREQHRVGEAAQRRHLAQEAQPPRRGRVPQAELRAGGQRQAETAFGVSLREALLLRTLQGNFCRGLAARPSPMGLSQVLVCIIWHPTLTLCAPHLSNSLRAQ